MSLIWDKCDKLKEHVISVLDNRSVEIHEPGMEKFNYDGWTNRVWNSNSYRRAHVDVVDATETRKLWMMHVCIMPHTHNSGPIFGLDIVAGERKVTGFFLDYSMGELGNDLDNYFSECTNNIEVSKQRDLPDWARNIFSDNMIAAGNIQDEDELDKLIYLAVDLLCFYIEEIEKLNNTQDPEVGKQKQNMYATNQKSNPHTPRVMKNLGLNSDDVDLFCSECLFPLLT